MKKIYRQKLRKSTLAILISVLISYIIGACSSDNYQNSTSIGQSNSADSWVKQANNKFKNEDFNGAFNDANKALEIDSNLGDAYFIRGMSRYSLGEQQQGIEDVKTAANIYNNKNATDRFESASAILDKMQQNPQNQEYATPEPSPTPPQIAECSVDISGVLANLEDANRAIDPAILRGRLIIPLAEGKLTYPQVANNPNCGAEKEQLRSLLQVSWQQYLTASYTVGQILAQALESSCRSNCDLVFPDGSETCKAQCSNSYQSELERLSREREIGDQEMRGFFGN